MSDFKQVALDCLQRQFGYTNIAGLMQEKAVVFNRYADIATIFDSEIMNFDTCISSALDYFWGLLFKVSRHFKADGVSYHLTDDQFREVIKIRAFGTSWDGTVSTMNLFLKDLFKERGCVYMIDALNMTTLIFAFDFELEDWERALFPQILPRPAGVGSEIELQPIEQMYFGFETYQQIMPSPITTGFGTYNGDPTGMGRFATYKDKIGDL